MMVQQSDKLNTVRKIHADKPREDRFQVDQIQEHQDMSELGNSDIIQKVNYQIATARGKWFVLIAMSPVSSGTMCIV